MAKDINDDIDDASATISESRRVKPGAEDEFGDTVIHVYVATERFIVYTARNGARDEGRMRYVLPDSYPAARRLRARLAPVAVELAHVSDVLADIRRTDTVRSRVLQARTQDLMARAIQMAFEENPDTARALLARAYDEVTIRRDSRNRMRYVAANVIAVLLILAAWAVLDAGWQVPGLSPWLTEARPLAGDLTFRLHDALALGALGAFFSVSASVPAIRVNHCIGVMEMLYTGFVRVPIGVIAAGILVILISGGWILASVDPRVLDWSLYLFAFIAGFSESLVPNVLKQAEGSTKIVEPSAEPASG